MTAGHRGLLRGGRPCGSRGRWGPWTCSRTPSPSRFWSRSASLFKGQAERGRPSRHVIRHRRCHCFLLVNGNPTVATAMVSGHRLNLVIRIYGPCTSRRAALSCVAWRLATLPCRGPCPRSSGCTGPGTATCGMPTSACRCATPRLPCRPARHQVQAPGPRNPRRSAADHQNPVMTCHLPGGEPERVRSSKVHS
jgi:hypothetical protein